MSIESTFRENENDHDHDHDHDDDRNDDRTAPVSKYESLEGEAGLWKKWRADGDIKARDRLINHYLSYTRALVAKLYARRTHDEFEFEEYMQFATVGLMESVNRFDPDRGVLFKTYVTTRINGAVLTGLTSLSERQQQINLRRRVSEERLSSLKAEQLSSAPEKLLRELAEIGIGLALGYLLEGTGMMADSEDNVPDNTYTRLEFRQLQQQIIFLSKRLTPREQMVIQMHYHQNLSFEEIGQELKLTKGRISQLHKQGLVRLRSLILQIESCDVAL